MTKFSDRYGYTSPEKVFQRETASPELRTALWNVLNISVWDKWEEYSHGWSAESERINLFVRRWWILYSNADFDSLPVFKQSYGNSGAYDLIKRYFFGAKWFEVFNFLEYLAQDKAGFVTPQLLKLINDTLERHNSAYRLVGKEVVEITDKGQIEAIQKALEAEMPPVRSHIERSLAMLSDKSNPDYRNSIKESVSAVEAACREVSGQPTATLGDALKKIRGLHPALQKGFSALYGYTSDAEGIRHALLDEPTLTKQDAVFMLVACSAFIGYLLEYKNPPSKR